MTDRLISCDDHMDLSQLPADLWTTRLPASLLDRAPHVEERDGQSVWGCDGKVWGRWGRQATRDRLGAPGQGALQRLRPCRNLRPERAPSSSPGGASCRHGPRRRGDTGDLRADPLIAYPGGSQTEQHQDDPTARETEDQP